MKKLVGAFLLLCACVGLVFWQLRAQLAEDPSVSQSQAIREVVNREHAWFQASQLVEDPSVSQAIRDVVNLEYAWFEAAKAGDTDKLGRMLADDWIGIAVDGRIQTKQSLLADMKAGALNLESSVPGHMYVKVIGDGDVAVVLGSDTEKSFNWGKDTSGKWVWMDVFVKRKISGGTAVATVYFTPVATVAAGDSEWVAVASQSSVVQE